MLSMLTVWRNALIQRGNNIVTDSLVHAATVERLADAVTAVFIADIHSRVPGLCGQPIKYSSKAFTPSVGHHMPHFHHSLHTEHMYPLIVHH